MASLINPQNTIEVIQKYSFVFQKKFGQNFLIDKHVLDKIITVADITKDDVVLEIGPGIGAITQALAETAGKVVAVEIDRDLIGILADTLKDYSNVTVINADIMKMDLVKLAEEYGNGKKLKVVANLPYYITTPIIIELFKSRMALSGITVMVQKEVADRMKASPGSKDYGAVSIAVQYFSKPYIAAYVPQNCFMPRPNVDSAVISLEKYDEPPVQVDDEEEMFRIIKAAFSQRRKTLQNCISHAENLNYTKEQVSKALETIGLNESVRGEALSIEDFAKFTNVLLGM